MSTETQTAMEVANENWQAEGEWILIVDSPGGTIRIGDAQLVCVVHSKGGGLDDDIEFAMRDPSRVLNVLAMPEVVEAAQNVLDDARFDHGPDGSYPLDARTREVTQALSAVLSAVHPATQGDKT